MPRVPRPHVTTLLDAPAPSLSPHRAFRTPLHTSPLHPVPLHSPPLSWYLQQLAPSLVAQLQQARHQGQAAPGEQQQQQQQQPEEPSGGLGEASEGGSSKVKGKAGGNSGPEAAAAAVAAGGAAGGSDGTGPVAGISRAELVRLVEWKLARGKWRPRLAAFALEQVRGGGEGRRAAGAVGVGEDGAGALGRECVGPSTGAFLHAEGGAEVAADAIVCAG